MLFLYRAGQPCRCVECRTALSSAMDRCVAFHREGSAVRVNEFGQNIGPAISGWTPRPTPPRTPMRGAFCSVEPLDLERHTVQLYETFAEASPASWTFLPEYMGPHKTLAAWREWLTAAAASN